MGKSDAWKTPGEIGNQVTVFPDGRGVLVKEPDHAFNVRLANKLIKMAEEAMENQKSLVEQVLDAKQALGAAVDHFRKDALDWMTESKALLQDQRAFKYAVVREVEESKDAFKGIREFFLDPNHAELFERLRSFVEVCEKLRGLKADGTLDAVADTILRLACNEPSHDKGS